MTEDRPGASPCCCNIIIHHMALSIIFTWQTSQISDYWSHDMNSEDGKTYNTTNNPLIYLRHKT